MMQPDPKPRAGTGLEDGAHGGTTEPPVSAVAASRTAWLERLLRAASEAPVDDGPDAAAQVVLEALAAAMPACALAVRLGERDGSPHVVAVPTLTTQPARGGHAPLFPGLTHEWSQRVRDGHGSVLVCGTNDPAIEASDSELSLVLAHGTAALRLALRTAHALRANRELAREVGLLQAGIVQTGKLASLGELSASVVHELGNPLTSIMAYCDYLLRRAEGSGAAPDDVERLRRIGEAADRILELTRALISYARPDDAGTCPLDVHQVVDRALVFCEHVVDAAGVSVRRELPEALPPVPGVRSQLIQVFVNLVTNACQAMTPAGGTLTVSARVEIGVEQVLVSFADSGPGIAPEHLPRIFEPFFTTKERGEGTGLGLSIVRCIVEAHGGTIRVESRVGKGTTFLVSLPSAIGPGA